MSILLSAIFSAFLISACGAWFMAARAHRLGLIDRPNERSSHSRPIPRGGGIGILAAFVGLGLWLKIPFGFLFAGAFVSLLSFFDDRFDLSARVRFIGQFLAATVALHALGSLDHALWIFPFAAIFVVGSANFYNFMDGINGIAGVTGVVGFGLLAGFAAMQGDTAIMMLAASIAAACLGFLPFNLPNARVFMGDVGSVLLGFVFALLVIRLAADVGEFLALACCLFPFYADGVTTLFVRWRDGEKLSQAHRRHLYQLLANQMQRLHWQVTLLYGVIQLLIGGVMLAAAHSGPFAVIGLFVVLSLLFLATTMTVRRKIEAP